MTTARLHIADGFALERLKRRGFVGRVARRPAVYVLRNPTLPIGRAS